MIDNKFNVRRYITEFSDETEVLLAEYYLSSFELNKFQVEFGESKTENPMLDSYPIKKNNVNFLKNYTTKEPDWDFVNRSYFLEAHAL